MEINYHRSVTFKWLAGFHWYLHIHHGKRGKSTIVRREQTKGRSQFLLCRYDSCSLAIEQVIGKVLIGLLFGEVEGYSCISLGSPCSSCSEKWSAFLLSYVSEDELPFDPCSNSCPDQWLHPIWRRLLCLSWSSCGSSREMMKDVQS